MFVPRALRLKGLKETQKYKKATKASTVHGTTSSDDGLVEAMQNTSTTSPVPPNEQTESKPAARGTNSTTAPVTPEYIAQLAAGIELIFTDYAHRHPESARWLAKYYRKIEGEEKCEPRSISSFIRTSSLILVLVIHLSAILENHNIATLKPEATQVSLRQAIQERGSINLQLSLNGFYVRRRPSTYPLSFVPHDSFSIVDDEGLSFWDQRTIYVEPHIRHLCKTPAKVAHWLQEHGGFKAKWLPIQAVETLYPSCGFVVLSGNVLHEDVWKKWRSTEKPQDWKIMTKVEHAKRTKEYLDLLETSRADLKRKHSPRTAIRDADVGDDAHAANTDVIAKALSATKHKKRKKRKNEVANTT